MVKSQTEEAGFRYLFKEKNKQNKISQIQYKQLKMQDYLLNGNKNTGLAKLIYKARGKTLDIKSQKKWKYKDDLCVGCSQNIESESEILTCVKFCDENEVVNWKLSYNMVFSDTVNDMFLVAKELQKKLKKRNNIIDSSN